MTNVASNTGTDLDKAALKSASVYAVAFSFSSLNEEESHLSDMENYLKNMPRNSEEQSPCKPSSPKENNDFVAALIRQNNQIGRAHV